METRNKKREFDELAKKKLGKYVYILQDPRDGNIFYVGQGINNRLFDHFYEAENKANLIGSLKTNRIQEIWNDCVDVGWSIIAHNLNDNEADVIESAVYNALKLNKSSEILNDVKPPKSTALLQEDIIEISAEPINPTRAFNRVFIFPIHNVLSIEKSKYEATRKYWKVSKENRQLPAFAVGIKNNVSVGSFLIKEWKQFENKFEFVGDDEFDLLEKNWTTVINSSKGYWQRGNYLIVEFDGQGSFRVLKGNRFKEEWIKC